MDLLVQVQYTSKSQEKYDLSTIHNHSQFWYMPPKNNISVFYMIIIVFFLSFFYIIIGWLDSSV